MLWTVSLIANWHSWLRQPVLRAVIFTQSSCDSAAAGFYLLSRSLATMQLIGLISPMIPPGRTGS
jgi:hypothetical protein